MTGRTPRDGKPFYCVNCGAGYGEYVACELPDCKLEGEESAELRALMVASEERAGKRAKARA